ncbi:MAG: hydantoinase/oxoprolinase family protein [Proteobacteria bacterium]|nr:hydantoinase/oxoprolinase family protein [Burkholderiales bacterium]
MGVPVQNAWSLGIDIGGTFTDIVVYNHGSGSHVATKVLTTLDDPARAVLDGTRRVLHAHRVQPAEIVRVVHATTLFTNALIERKGALTGLLTTAGFRDVLEIGRERKYDLYDLNIRNPEPLIPRNLRVEVTERMGADGAAITALDEAEVRDRARSLVDAGATSIAIVFLHSYANAAHERLAAQIVRQQHPALAVTASSEVVPEIREFERASTAAANAYVKPLADRYLARMSLELRALGIEAPLLLMLSNGGLTHVEEAKRTPVQLLESGPAAGALAASHFGVEDRNLLAFDMGGTTAKLSLIDDGEPLLAYGFEAARQRRFVEGSGLPIRISTIELIEIGAGGGSIAHTDEIGLLKVGPESAGSQPGPACYGLGGLRPTVTDANLLLGILNPDFFAGGTLQIDAALARQAVGALAHQLGLSIDKTAWGIHDVVSENMASAARVHIAERGRDPRRYSLLTTGGGGPVHGFYVARKLGLKQLICPPSAGVASALGLLAAPARIDRVATVSMTLEGGDFVALERAFIRLEDEARSVIGATGVDLTDLRVARAGDGRFIGQGFNLVFDLPDGPYDRDSKATMVQLLGTAFDRAYRKKFARTPPQVAMELVNIRVTVTASVPGSSLAPRAVQAAEVAAGPRIRPVYFPEIGTFIDTAVHQRAALEVGFSFDGPALIEEPGTTLVVGPQGRGRVAPSGNIVVTLA